MSREEFMQEIAAMTQHIVDRAKSYDSDTIPGDFGGSACPVPGSGGGKIKETYKKFQCQSCDYGLGRSSPVASSSRKRSRRCSPSVASAR